MLMKAVFSWNYNDVCRVVPHIPPPEWPSRGTPAVCNHQLAVPAVDWSERRERESTQRDEKRCLVFFHLRVKNTLWKNTAASAFPTSPGSFHCTLRSI